MTTNKTKTLELTPTQIKKIMLLALVVMIPMCFSLLLAKTKHDFEFPPPVQTTVASEEQFLTMLVPYLEESVAHSIFITMKTSDTELQTFANNLITMQSQQIVNTKTWISQWYNKTYNNPGTYKPNMQDLSSVEYVNLDKAYINSMVAHYEAGIELAKSVVSSGDTRQQTYDMAQQMIENYSANITYLKKTFLS